MKRFYAQISARENSASTSPACVPCQALTFPYLHPRGWWGSQEQIMALKILAVLLQHQQWCHQRQEGVPSASRTGLITVSLLLSWGLWLTDCKLLVVPKNLKGFWGKKESTEDISPAACVGVMTSLKLSALNKKLLSNKYLSIKSMWKNYLHHMLWRTMSKELFHQVMKNSKALEIRDNTWEGQETSGTWLQKC